jgi:hypothetical protein
MSEHVQLTLADVLNEIANLEAQLTEKKKLANLLYKMNGENAAFQNVDGSAASIRPDEFYGRPLATAVEEVLVRRKRVGLGAATVSEIYEVLKQGGFHFNTKNDENAKRNLYDKLAKNPKFHRLPNSSTYGLTAWYPNIKKIKDSKDQPEGAEEDEMDEELGGLAVTQDEFQDKPDPAADGKVEKQKSSRKNRDALEETACTKAMNAEHPGVQMATKES